VTLLGALAVRQSWVMMRSERFIIETFVEPTRSRRNADELVISLLFAPITAVAENRGIYSGPLDNQTRTRLALNGRSQPTLVRFRDRDAMVRVSGL
jgi:hypothetical protein